MKPRLDAPRAGVIGLGRIACVMEDDPLRDKPCTHVGAYLKQGCKLVAGCDIDGERRIAFGKRFKVDALFESYQVMLETQPLDVLSICAYATERYAMLMNAIDYQVPAIFCEKAFATSLEEADEMVQRLHETHTKCVVGHMRRWVPEYQSVARLLAENYIGEVQSVIGKFSGSVIHTGTHLFDVLNWWFGAPQAIAGHVDEHEGVDKQSGYRFSETNLGDLGGYGQIVFANGVVAYIEGRVKDYFVFELEIIGKQGRIRVGNEGLRLYLPKDSVRMTGFKELQPALMPAKSGIVQGTAWQGAVQSLLSETPAEASAEDARTALEMALAFYVSHRQGGREVELPLSRDGLKVSSR